MNSFSELRLLEEEHGDFHSHFDWWQASIDVDHLRGFDHRTGEVYSGVQVLKELLFKSFPMATWITTGGKNGYEWCDTLRRGDYRICTIMHGGVHSMPNITASGSRSAEVRGHVVQIVPSSGKVSRVDSAFDSMSGTGKFLEVTRWIEQRADAAGIKHKWIINSDPSEGNTLYVGSKSSRVQIRIYEKGKQMGSHPDEWWRVEVQLRPDSKSKGQVYNWSAGMVWSASAITRDLWSYLGGEKLQAVDFQFHDKEKDLSDRLLHLANQYGNLIAEALQIHGSPAALVGVLDDLLIESGKPAITGRKLDRAIPSASCPF